MLKQEELIPLIMGAIANREKADNPWVTKITISKYIQNMELFNSSKLPQMINAALNQMIEIGEIVKKGQFYAIASQKTIEEAVNQENLPKHQKKKKPEKKEKD